MSDVNRTNAGPEKNDWLNPETWVEDCDLCYGDHPEGPCQ